MPYQGQSTAVQNQRTLCVDLDHTLLSTDMLYETFARMAGQAPRDLWRVPLWLIEGKARLKREMASRVTLDWDKLPVNDELLLWLETERASGRPLALVSASDQKLVEAVAARFKIFDHAIGSDGRTNLLGKNKLTAIRQQFGDEFDYIGDSPVDRCIFEQAKTCVLVGDGSRLARHLPDGVNIERQFPTPKNHALLSWLSALRLYQWTKNVLVFVPVFLAGPETTWPNWIGAVLAFLMLSCFASAGYLVNDLVDLDADRQHPSKRYRPFAAGVLKIRDGLLGIPILFAIGCAAGMLLQPTAFGLGLIYFATSLTYSLVLKRVAMIDVVILAGLFTIRILTGVLAADVPISFWLLTFSMFFFLNLALVKRYAELRDLSTRAGTSLIHRGYTSLDSPLLLAIGSGAVMASCGIFVSYLLNEQFPKQIYANPSFLWLIFPTLLFWMIRIWHLAIHGRMNEDPVIFALRDRISQLHGLFIALCLWLAW